MGDLERCGSTGASSSASWGVIESAERSVVLAGECFRDNRSKRVRLVVESSLEFRSVCYSFDNVLVPLPLRRVQSGSAGAFKGEDGSP